MNFCGFLMDSEGFGGILENFKELLWIFDEFMGILQDL